VARRWLLKSRKMQHSPINRLEKFLNAGVLGRKHPDWGEIPTEGELRHYLQILAQEIDMEMDGC